MVCFNLQTICADRGPKSTTQRCQKYGYVPTIETTAAWNPSGLDTDEWARVAASFGARYIILVAGHMSGFTLWNTKAHNFSIAHTQYKGGGQDVVSDLIMSCKKYNLKLGFFYSVHFNWYLGVNNFQVGWPPLGPKNYTQAEYLAIAKAQLEEVIDLFGDEGPLEVWFDGKVDDFTHHHTTAVQQQCVIGIGLNLTFVTGGTGPSAAKIGPLVYAAAPKAVCHSCLPNFTAAGGIRWMGNEEGHMPLPSWGAAADALGAGPNGGGDPRGEHFMPPSTDTVLREHYWFWQNHTEKHIKSTKLLVNNYLTSVGRASNLILNIAPGPDGSIPVQDIDAYAKMGAAVKCLFSRPIGSTVAADPLHVDEAGKITWVLPATATEKTSVNMSLVIREDQRDGQLINQFLLQCKNSSVTSEFAPCSMGGLAAVIPSTMPAVGIGHKRILMLADHVGLAALRFVVTSNFAQRGGKKPRLRDIALYDWTGVVEACV